MDRLKTALADRYTIEELMLPAPRTSGEKSKVERQKTYLVNLCFLVVLTVALTQ